MLIPYGIGMVCSLSIDSIFTVSACCRRGDEQKSDIIKVKFKGYFYETICSFRLDWLSHHLCNFYC